MQTQWDALTTIIKELEEQYIPSKIVDVNGDDRFGEKLPNHIRMQIKKKHNLWKCIWIQKSLKYIMNIAEPEIK